MTGIEERRLVTLRPGYTLVIFGCTPHGGFAALNHVNLRANIYVTINRMPVMSNSVIVIKPNSSILSYCFR